MEKLTFASVNPGDVLPPFTRSVNQETFWKYAVASFDYNPVHNDPEWVKTAQPFKIPYTVGHGMMTMSFMTSLVTTWALPSGLQVRKIVSKFTRPVELGWEIICTGVVSEKHLITKGKNFVMVDVRAENQKGDLLALSEIEVVFPD
jgi:3-hydroxybutyryl-CoA dehydratase